MDFRISSYQKAKKIAEEDIVIYKDVILTERNNNFYSSSRSFPYTTGYEYTETDFDIDTQHLFGYRAFTDLKICEGRALALGTTIVEFYIPKGTPYYINSVTSEVLTRTIGVKNVIGRPGSRKEKYEPTIFENNQNL